MFGDAEQLDQRGAEVGRRRQRGDVERALVVERGRAGERALVAQPLGERRDRDLGAAPGRLP